MPILFIIDEDGDGPLFGMATKTIRINRGPTPEFVRGTPAEIVMALRIIWNDRHRTEHVENCYMTNREYHHDRPFMHDLLLAVMQDTGMTPAWHAKDITPEGFLAYMRDTGRITVTQGSMREMGALVQFPEECAKHRERLLARLRIAMEARGDYSPLPGPTWL